MAKKAPPKRGEDWGRHETLRRWRRGGPATLTRVQDRAARDPDYRADLVQFLGWLIDQAKRPRGVERQLSVENLRKFGRFMYSKAGQITETKAITLFADQNNLPRSALKRAWDAMPEFETTRFLFWSYKQDRKPNRK